jgi:hypothetical protein
MESEGGARASPYPSSINFFAVTPANWRFFFKRTIQTPEVHNENRKLTVLVVGPSLAAYGWRAPRAAPTGIFHI